MKSTLLFCTLALCATAIYCAQKLAPQRYSLTSGQIGYAVDQKTGKAYAFISDDEFNYIGMLDDFVIEVAKTNEAINLKVFDDAVKEATP